MFESTLHDLRRKLAAVDDQRATLEEQRELLLKAIEALERLDRGEVRLQESSGQGGSSLPTTIGIGAGATHSRPRRRGPGTGPAVLQILNQSDRPLTDREILLEMERRGWSLPSPNPLNALRATLSRLRRSEQIVRQGSKGPYYIPRSGTPNGEPGVPDHSSTERRPDGPAVTE